MTALATSEPPPDAVLAAAYQRGDERAAAQLVRRHAAAVARFLYSSGAPSAELDDLMQDTFFRAFRRSTRGAVRPRCAAGSSPSPGTCSGTSSGRAKDDGCFR